MQRVSKQQKMSELVDSANLTFANDEEDSSTIAVSNNDQAFVSDNEECSKMATPALGSLCPTNQGKVLVGNPQDQIELHYETYGRGQQKLLLIMGD